MRRAIAYLLVFLCTAPLAAQSSAAVTLVKAAHLLDPRTGKVLSPAAVLIEGNKIKEVGTPERLQADAPPGVKTLDLGGTTLLPGLIDGHTHLFLNIIVPPQAEIERHFDGLFAPGMLLAVVESPSKRALLGAQMAREDLESGITTVRNLGHSGIDGDTQLRDAINGGRATGPRMLASGRKLIAQGAYVHDLNPALSNAIFNQEFLLVEGSEGARQAVRANLSAGADVIKVTVAEDISVAELTAVVTEAHRQHLKVAVHAGDVVSIQTAIDAGADSIEHGNEVTDEQLSQMSKRGIFLDLTPTFYKDGFLKFIDGVIVLSADDRARLVASGIARTKKYDALVQRVLKSGVKFATGSDMCWFYPGKTRGEASVATFVNLGSAGMPPLDVIRAVTTNAAEMLGWQDRIGALEPGKFADLIAVEGDPLADITELERIKFVMKDGQVVRNDLGARD